MMKTPEAFDESVNFLGLLFPFWNIENDLTWVNNIWMVLGGTRFTRPFLEPIGYFRSFPKWFFIPFHLGVHIFVPNFIYQRVLNGATDTT